MSSSERAPLILIADDDPDILALVGNRLARAGYEVQTAPDGSQALEMAQRRTPDLAVLDVAMPGLDGHELTRRLRAEEATRDMPIVILTAAARERDHELSMQAGANLHIRKPFSPRQLTAEVDALLGRGS
ncbi:MAG TPA: response regulator [Solirubrobacteraceae bacterium]|jgi:DNA-binding response OmpR family regulator|nr:response regulator [Solirubrobacteraceae bacterium]